MVLKLRDKVHESRSDRPTRSGLVRQDILLGNNRILVVLDAVE
jgi:hypothetical protein